MPHGAPRTPVKLVKSAPPKAPPSQSSLGQKVEEKRAELTAALLTEAHGSAVGRPPGQSGQAHLSVPVPEEDAGVLGTLS